MKRRPPASTPAAALFAALTLLSAACSDDGGPSRIVDPPPEPSFYPLAIGNSWTYEITNTTRMEYLDGSKPPKTLVFQGSDTRTIIGMETIDGVEYFVEESVVTTNTDPDGSKSWRRYRQDDDGFYRSTVSTTVPAELSGVAAADVQDNESRRIQYPLEVGAEWIVSGPARSPLTARVEAQETVAVPAGDMTAWKIRFTGGIYTDESEYFIWYSRCGGVLVKSHFEQLAVDAETGLMVRITIDEIGELTNLALDPERSCP